VLTWTILPSPVDDLLLASSDGLLRTVWFSPHKAKPTATFVEEMTRAGGVRDDAEPVLVETSRQLGDYFRGERRAFDLPLGPVGTAFQLQVWDALRTIPYGVTWSYGAIAAAIGKGPESARAVGLANGSNPLSIVVPCHRVIGADGSLTGFGGGLERKRYLLDLEQPTLFS
jgi:methylated-DNA-[protein]-cysteine S-methyltransferase